MAKRSRKRTISSKSIRKKFPHKMQQKLVALFGLVLLVFAILVMRVTYLNAFKGDKYTKTVLNQQNYDSRTLPFKRGDILDSNGTRLATSEKVYNVVLDAKALLEDQDDVTPTVSVLSQVFKIDSQKVYEVLSTKPNSRYNVLLKDVDYSTAQKFEAMDADDKKYPNLAGVWLEDSYKRKYPLKSLACDVIGFSSASNQGSIGLEAYYNDILNGTNGREYGYFESDSVQQKTVKEATDGQTIVTSIDAKLQKIVEEKVKKFNESHTNGVKKGPGSKNTGVIIMNPNTGEILAEASYPDFDLNNPSDLTAWYTEKEISKMSEEDTSDTLNQLWNNFCVSSTYEPGSTVKPFTVATGLETGALTGKETYTCTGYLHVGDHDIHCHNRSGHGTLDTAGAIAQSCNVALMKMAAKIGPENFVKYQHIFGFGEYTGIDLPGDSDTSALLYKAEDMGSSDLATNAFGQNFNVTMTQLLSGFCSLINGGNYYQPHVVKKIQDSNGNVVENVDPVLVKKTISEETSEKLKKYMRETITEGTGKGYQVEGYDIGGKTGTAEKLPRSANKYVLSFCGFAPVDNPEVAIYIVIDEPNVIDQSSSSYISGLGQSILKEVLPYLNITKTKSE